MSRDLASAYVLCLRTFVVPNLQRRRREFGEVGIDRRTEEIDKGERS